MKVFVLDYTQSPPRNIGQEEQAFLTSLAGWTYHETQELSTVLRAEGVLASARRATLTSAPAVAGGDGRALRRATVLRFGGRGRLHVGDHQSTTRGGSHRERESSRDRHSAPRWRAGQLRAVGRAQASYSSLITGVGQSTGLGLCAAGGEVRYGVSRWLGALAGFDFRYATFDTPGQFNPPFLQ